jgi:hypothetical protein
MVESTTMTPKVAKSGSILTLDMDGKHKDQIRVGKPGEYDPSKEPNVEASDSKWVSPFIGKPVGHVAHVKGEHNAVWTVTLEAID